MAICPECGEEIERLMNECRVTQFYECYLDERGNMEYDHVDSGSGDNEGYYCPECEALLFSSEDEAHKFLRGYIEEEPRCPMLRNRG